MLPSSSLLRKHHYDNANTRQKSAGASRKGRGPRELSGERSSRRDKPSFYGGGEITKAVFKEDYWHNGYHLLVTHQAKGDLTVFLIEYSY